MFRLRIRSAGGCVVFGSIVRATRSVEAIAELGASMYAAVLPDPSGNDHICAPF